MVHFWLGRTFARGQPVLGCIKVRPNQKRRDDRWFIFKQLHFLHTPIQPARAQKMQLAKNDSSVAKALITSDRSCFADLFALFLLDLCIYWYFLKLSTDSTKLCEWEFSKWRHCTQKSSRFPNTGLPFFLLRAGECTEQSGRRKGAAVAYAVYNACRIFVRVLCNTCVLTTCQWSRKIRNEGGNNEHSRYTLNCNSGIWKPT